MAKLVINTKHMKSKINKDIYGHFSEHLGRCIYEGLYVGMDSEIPNTNGMRNDVVEALRQIRIPVLRWPGGCFADEYHWKDGVGPGEERKKIVNTHWGGVVEDNSFGTHEFMELCDQLGCDVYINGNVGSGTVQEMSEWVEYLTSDGVSPMADLRKKNGRQKPWRVKYFGVGNENWGCGGNMLPEAYGNLYRQYQTYVRNYDPENRIRKIACGANVDDYDWTEGVLETIYKRVPAEVGPLADGLSLHHYTFLHSFEDKGSATDFDAKDWYHTLKNALYMETLIQRHGTIMDKYDPEKKVGMIIDEWGTWFEVEPGTNPGFLYQQNTMRDAIVAALNLNMFNKHSDRVTMANIAQTVNVLQSVVLTEGEKMLLTPTWHVFDMYKYHQDATLLDSRVEIETIGIDEYQIPNLSESVSVDQDGKIHITVANLSHDRSYPIDVKLLEGTVFEVKGEILVNRMDARNTFMVPDLVKKEVFTDVTAAGDEVHFTAPACSVIHIELSQ